MCLSSTYICMHCKKGNWIYVIRFHLLVIHLSSKSKRSLVVKLYFVLLMLFECIKVTTARTSNGNSNIDQNTIFEENDH